MTVKLSNLTEYTAPLADDYIAASTDVGAGVLVTKKIKRSNFNYLSADAAGRALMEDEFVTTAKIDNLAVTTAKLEDDAVDDTKAGNRVPQFYRRQGGSDTDWSTEGTASKTPTTVRMQAGVCWVLTTTLTVTFPEAFSNAPIVILGLGPGTAATGCGLNEAPTSSSFKVDTWDKDGVASASRVHWLAIGPE